MTDPDEEIERPATWENVVVGKAKEALGHVVRDPELVAEGEEQEDAAHEVREEFTEQRDE
ncbi:hypothetical protein [Jatrophihabitans endophyticus]|uniref:hypothetical protein n=1 Tax=Jatrophihabitans endophyticus TaxID=1206085 RepID=UPI0019FD5FCA|nr:hypothetical protein [Jatrophihabitans endophyticus]MBE7190594.1 hypothetical protein [Jatrophihabitans endophyticus]